MKSEVPLVFVFVLLCQYCAKCQFVLFLFRIKDAKIEVQSEYILEDFVVIRGVFANVPKSLIK